MLRLVSQMCVLCVLSFSVAQTVLAQSETFDGRGDGHYAQRILSIDTSLGHVITKETVLEDDAFSRLADERKNVDDCISFLLAKGYSNQQRMIAILSMYKLSLPDYVKFIHGLARTLDENSLSRHELNLAIANYSTQTMLIENYKNESVRGVLRLIREKPNIDPSSKKGIDDILSGRALYRLESERRTEALNRILSSLKRWYGISLFGGIFFVLLAVIGLGVYRKRRK